MRNEKGFTLIGVIIALALLGMIVVAFFGALSTASKVLFVADERATAESLARSQMEYVKNQDYSIAPWAYEVTTSSRTHFDAPSWWDVENDIPPYLSSNYGGYSVKITAEDFDGDGNPDEGIQKITVIIYHPYYDPVHPEENKVITLEGYKAER